MGGYNKKYRDGVAATQEGLELANKHGDVRSSVSNAVMILGRHPWTANNLRLNESTKKMEWIRRPKWTAPLEEWPAWESHCENLNLTDDDINHIWALLDCPLYHIQQQHLRAGLQAVSSRNRYHPIKEYFEALQWDGKPRIATMLTDFFGGVSTEYTRAIATNFMLAAVMRTYRPGTKYDSVLIIKAPQGTKKSTFVQRLGLGKWHVEMGRDLENKDNIMRCYGHLICEFAEGVGLNDARAVNSTKAFVTRTSDTIRVPYGHATETWDRTFVFCATTNDGTFLYDRTGNRRFQVFEPDGGIPRLDVFKDLNKEYVDQLWAEAYAKVAGENFETRLHLSAELEALSANIAESYTSEDDDYNTIQLALDTPILPEWYDLSVTVRKAYLRNYMESGAPELATMIRKTITKDEIWQEILGHSEIERRDIKDNNHINSIMENMKGWRKARDDNGELKIKRTPGYRRDRYYERISTPQTQPQPKAQTQPQPKAKAQAQPQGKQQKLDFVHAF